MTNIIRLFSYRDIYTNYKIKGKNELKEIDMKNCLCYYFDNTINGTKIKFSNILLEKNYKKIFQFITFRIKLQHLQNHCVLASIKYIDLL